MATTSKTSIYEKLLKAQQSAEPVTKGGVNTGQNYKYVRATDALNACRNAFNAAGLSVIFTSKELSRELVEREKTDRNSGVITKSIAFISTVEVEARIFDTDGECITVTATGHGYDPTDKAAFKAITGAEKYAALAILGQSGDDDPEGDPKTDADKITGSRGKQDNRTGQSQQMKNPDGPATEKQLTALDNIFTHRNQDVEWYQFLRDNHGDRITKAAASYLIQFASENREKPIPQEARKKLAPEFKSAQDDLPFD